MIKIKVLMLVAACAVFMTGCNGSDKSVSQTDHTDATKEDTSTERIDVVKVEGDRRVYYSLDELERFSQIAVIGEFTNDTEQKLDYEYDSEFGKEILVNATSWNEIKVIKVLKGDVPDGLVKISQRYGIQEEPKQLVTFSEMTPIRKGDKWVFFLYI